MIAVLTLLLCLLFSSPLFAAAAVDANSESGCTSCSADSWSHTNAGDLLVCSSAQTDSTTVTAFTHNSLALTQHATKAHGTRAINMWLRIAPTAGVQTVAKTISGSATSTASGCTSLTGAHQTTPLGTAQFNTNDGDLTTSPPSITVPANGIAYDVVFFNNPDAGCQVPTPGGSQTLQLDFCADGGAGAQMIVAASTRATTGTMPWTNLAGAFEGQIAVPISEASAPPSGTARRRVIVVE